MIVWRDLDRRLALQVALGYQEEQEQMEERLQAAEQARLRNQDAMKQRLQVASVCWPPCGGLHAFCSQAHHERVNSVSQQVCCLVWFGVA